MSRSMSVELKAHLASETTSLAMLWTIERADAVAFYMTNHVDDITYDGHTYQSNAGLLATTLSQDRSLGIDNMEAVSIFLDDQITSEDVQAGLFENATAEIKMVNYEDLSMGDVVIAQGWRLGNVEIRDHAMTAELRGITQRLRQEVGWYYQQKCRAILGDARCGIDLDDPVFYEDGEVQDHSENTQISFYTDLAPPSDDPDAFRYGKVTWTTGLNVGLSMEIASYDSDTGLLKLFLSMPYEIEAGDTFRARFGCDKVIQTCEARFSNVVNFRGEPYVSDGRNIKVAIRDLGAENRHGWGR